MAVVSRLPGIFESKGCLSLARLPDYVVVCYVVTGEYAFQSIKFPQGIIPRLSANIQYPG
jgi:hypothetical protein